MRHGSYRVRLDEPRQTIWGLGVELQPDTIGSGNLGLPDTVSGIPHDLVESERERFYDMLEGFRYLRLPMGLYLRGTRNDGKNITERWDGQLDEIAETIEESGIEGASVEYWSPPPYWKDNDQYRGGSLESFDEAFLEEFGDALVEDVDHLVENDVPVSMWGLQNEPPVDHGKYSTCAYTDEQYYEAFRVVAPKIAEAFPDVHISANSMAGQFGRGSARIRADEDALACVDGWTWHKIGTDSNDQIDNNFTRKSMGRPVYNNEFEYFVGQHEGRRFLNTAQSVLNWMTFQNAPTWFWLHALKPTTNEESEGFGLGLWEPPHAEDTSYDIESGHFDFVDENWNALEGFLEFLDWDSTRYHVEESTVRYDNRIMAWQPPDSDDLRFALTNRSGEPYRFDIDVGDERRFKGRRYRVDQRGIPLTVTVGPDVSLTVPDGCLEFWVED